MGIISKERADLGWMIDGMEMSNVDLFAVASSSGFVQRRV
jgi:hypothetical protein